MTTLSIVAPVYNEELLIKEFCNRVSHVLQGMGVTYEIILVNDGSRDGTRAIIQQLVKEDPRIKAIHFSRNFGQPAATTAGIDYAKGEAIITIDTDLQDPPELIEEMFKKWKEGDEVVYAHRIKREGETWFKKVSANLFYRILNRLSSVPIPVDVGDFRLLDRKAVDTLKKMPERDRYIRGMVSWVGFKQTSVDYTRDPRTAGETKYSIRKLISMALSGILSFSYKPLRLATYLGFFSSFAGFIYIFEIFYQKLILHQGVEGWASLMAVSLFFNGLILFILGIIGEYIGRIFTEAKHRPLYVVDEIEGI